jgi:glycosyltransferase involved in cell wall biosynthesis
MLVSGFTVIRNAEIMGYPIVESIRSILPLVDEYVIGVGQSDDQTRKIIEAIGDPKIKIFDSVWDKSKTQGGLILSEKTNEALERCLGDWCFYLQADEVVHEEDLNIIRTNLEKYKNDSQVEGLLFDYVHFYGSYSVIGTSRSWYRNEVRIVKRSAKARSVGDAQGFRVGERKPNVVPSGAKIYHYGWVKPPIAMGEKKRHMERWWHGNKYDESFKDFAYKTAYGLRYFKGSHPRIMEPLVAKQDWKFVLKKGFSDWNLRDVKNMLSDVLEFVTSHRIGEHKNYVLLKTSTKES